jgi:hypothetical protein
MSTLRIALAFTLMAPGVLAAHHGVSRYRMDVVATLEGTVERWDFDEPHTWLTVAVEGAVWQIEGAPPRWMRGQGFTPESLAVGEPVRVTYHPHRSSERAGILMAVRRADGSVRKVNRPASLGGP